MHDPVFVDDTGRRHRAARVVGATAGLVTLVYLGVVAGTFAGVPGLGTAPGLGELTNPAGAQADVGTDPLDQPALVIPADGLQPTESPDPSTTSTAPTSAPTPAVTTTTAPPTTVPATPPTTRERGQGNSPNSTVPGHGPPTSKP